MRQAGRYATDRPIVRLRDTDGDGNYDEKLSYIQNWRGDVVALVKRVAKLDAMTADAAERKLLDPKAELPESAQITLPTTPSTWTGTDAVSTAIRAALVRQGYKLSALEAAGDKNLPPLDVPGRGMVVERYSYGLYGDPDTQAFVDTARTNLLVSQDAIDKHAEVFGWSIDYIGTDGLRGDLRADVDGDGMISSWDQLRFAQQQTAWTLIYFDQLAANSDEMFVGWSSLGQLSRPHPVGMKPTGEPLDPGTTGRPGPRELHQLRGVVQIDNRLGYAGYVWDPFLQMYHVRHRVLNPRLGIWMQPDPIGYAGGWNLHEYAGGDPLGFVDPMGLDFIDSVKDLIGDAVDGIQEGWDLFTGAAAQRDSAWDSASAKAVAGCVRQAKQLEQQGELEKAGKVRCQCSQMMGGLRGAMNQLAGIRQKQWKEIGDTARNAMVAPAGVFVAPATLIGQVAFNVAGNVGLELAAGGDLRSAAIDGVRDGAMAWGVGKAVRAVGGMLAGRLGARGATARESAEQFLTLYRGERAGTVAMKSYAAREGGYAYSQNLIRNGIIDDLMRAHALDSRNPASPFISTTSDPNVARFFAGPNGVVHELRIPASRAIPNQFNNMLVPAGPGGRLVPESEFLVPNYIRPSEIIK